MLIIFRIHTWVAAGLFYKTDVAIKVGGCRPTLHATSIVACEHRLCLEILFQLWPSLEEVSSKPGSSSEPVSSEQ